MLPGGTRINGYEILAPIGAGGGGAVYRARQLGTSDEVALKVLNRPSASGARRFLEEARALSRARHPGVVRILAYGLSRESPYCAMELAHGQSLADWLHSLGSGQGADAGQTTARTRPLDRQGPGPSSGRAPRVVPPDARGSHFGLGSHALLRALGWVAQLCETLAFLHAEGVIHGDVKPRNVIVAEQGWPRLVDFGIASFGADTGREVTGLFAAAAGTRSYSAPERILGPTWDARADLYSIGCILHELVMGVPPLGAGRVDASLLAQRAGDAGLSSAWSDLVVALLAEDPRCRPAYAEDALRVLSSFRAEAPEPPAARRALRLHRPRLSGRNESLRRIEPLLRASLGSGPGMFVLLSGESGLGKTRLLSELLARSSALVLIADAVSDGPLGLAPEHRGPLAAFRPLLHALLACWENLDLAAQAALRGPGLVWVAGYEPALLPLLDPGAGTLPTLRPQEAREAMLQWFETALNVLARERGLLFIVDDLQWIDEASLELLSRFARWQVPPRVAFLCATRAGEESPLTQALLRSPAVHHERLGLLTDAEICALASDLLAQASLPPVFATRLVGCARGNPFLASALLEDAVRCQALVRGPHGGWVPSGGQSAWHEVGLSSSLRELVEARVTGLSDDARAALACASVLGAHFERETLASALGWPSARLDSALLELAACQLMGDASEDRSYFIHDSFCETILASLAPSERARLHAQALSARRGAARGRAARLADLLAMAHHAQQAANHDLGVRLLRRSAARLARLNANEQALVLLGEALTLRARRSEGAAAPARDAASCVLHERSGMLLSRVGRYDDAERELGLALARAPERPRTRARLHRQLAKVYTARHRHLDAARALVEAQTLLALPRSSLAAAREYLACAVELFWVHYFRDDRAAMSSTLAAVEPLLAARANRAQNATLHELRALLALREQRYQVSEAIVEEAQAAYELVRGTRDALTQGRAIFQLGLIRLFSAAPERAGPDLEAALRQARAHGDRLLEARSLTYLAVAWRRAAQLEQVVATAEQALALASAAGLTEYVGTARANLAWAALQRGDQPQVSAHGEAALQAWGNSRVVYPLRWLASLPLLCVSLERNERTRAETLARDLLSPSQMQLPEPLIGLLTGLLRADDRDSRVVADHLRLAAKAVDRL